MLSTLILVLSLAQCPGACPRPATRPVRVAPPIPPRYATDPGGHLYRWVLYSDGRWRLVRIR